MIDYSMYNAMNEAGWQMRARGQANMRMSRQEMVGITEALRKAGMNGIVHETSMCSRRGFGSVALK